MNSNIIYNNTSGNLSGVSGGTFNRFSDPYFVNANAGDYHLKSDSNCIDKGDSNLISPNETDIDGEARANGRVDIGADEFYTCTSIDVFPVGQPDGIVNFQDFVVLADAWMATSSGNGNYNSAVDFNYDGHINYKDLKEFCNCWLYKTAGYDSGQYSMMSMESVSPANTLAGSIDDSQQSSLAVAGTAEESQQSPSESEGSQQQSEEEQYLPDYNLPAIYLTCDNNTPQPNDEVTIQVHSVAPLFAMGLGIYISGDANITTAMCEADCNSFGWDNGWSSDPYIDPNGWVYLSGVKWAADVNGVVSYVKFRYRSGQVNVYIDQENSLTFEWNGDSCPIVPLSQEVLLISRDPNEP
jgi:hypothetical protein